MPHITGQNRDQITLFPESIDDYVDKDNPVRFIDAFVDNLPLKELGFYLAPDFGEGRPGYHPADLLKLYIYGYLNRAQSSRQLRNEARRNVEVMWLLKRLTPSFKTIADFRKHYKKPIREVCREFTLLCKKLDLFGGELIAIDGSKFKAVNSKKKSFTQAKLKGIIKDIDRQISDYLSQLDKSDLSENKPDNQDKGDLQGKIDKLRSNSKYFKDMAKSLEKSGETQVSMTDPDARSMSTKKGDATVGYNVQSVVDGKHKLIAEHEVTNSVVDRSQLSKMAIKAKETLGVEEINALADLGYYYGAEVKKCLDNGITAFIPKPYTSAAKKLGLFGKEDFVYDRESDLYLCPAGERLTFRYATTEEGRDIKYYVGRSCRTCSLRKKCTRAKKGPRRITRWVDEDILDDMERRVRERPEMTRLRKALVEHPFGTLKRWMGVQPFLTRGLSNVNTEMSLSVLAYNMKRAINILGTRRLISALT
jgi:transposase